jgi:hypothetical protein
MCMVVTNHPRVFTHGVYAQSFGLPSWVLPYYNELYVRFHWNTLFVVPKTPTGILLYKKAIITFPSRSPH